MKNTINIVLFLLLAAVGKAQNLSSPDGNLLLKTVVERGIPYYELSYKGKAVLAPSRLGLDIKYERGLMNDFSVKSVQTDSLDESWKPYGVSNRLSVTIITKCCLPWNKVSAGAR